MTICDENCFECVYPDCMWGRTEKQPRGGFGDRIKTQRLTAGLSQRKLAELLGISGNTVSKWELNLALPTPEKLDRLVSLFPELKKI